MPAAGGCISPPEPRGGGRVHAVRAERCVWEQGSVSEAAASRVGVLGGKRSVWRRKAVSCESGSWHLADERPWRLAPETVRVQCVQCLLWVLVGPSLNGR